MKFRGTVINHFLLSGIVQTLEKVGKTFLFAITPKLLYFIIENDVGDGLQIWGQVNLVFHFFFTHL